MKWGKRERKPAPHELLAAQLAEVHGALTDRLLELERARDEFRDEIRSRFLRLETNAAGHAAALNRVWTDQRGAAREQQAQLAALQAHVDGLTFPPVVTQQLDIPPPDLSEPLQRLDHVAAQLNVLHRLVEALTPPPADEKKWRVVEEKWVPGSVELPLPGDRRVHRIDSLHVALSQSHTGLLTVVAEGQVIFRRYVHTDADIHFATPFEIASDFQVWMGSGPHEVQQHSLSCCFTVRGRTGTLR